MNKIKLKYFRRLAYQYLDYQGVRGSRESILISHIIHAPQLVKTINHLRASLPFYLEPCSVYVIYPNLLVFSDKVIECDSISWNKTNSKLLNHEKVLFRVLAKTHNIWLLQADRSDDEAIVRWYRR